MRFLFKKKKKKGSTTNLVRELYISIQSARHFVSNPTGYWIYFILFFVDIFFR